MPGNEERRKVKSSRQAQVSMLDAILEGNQRMADAAERMQQGFNQMVEIDRKTEKGLEAIISALEVFQTEGGTIAATGMTGGAVTFTQLVDASVNGIVGGIKEALGGFFDDDRQAIRAVEKATLENNGVIRQAVSRSRSDRASRSASSFRGEPDAFAELKVYLNNFDQRLKQATSEISIDRETGERSRRTVTDVRSNLAELESKLTDFGGEIDESLSDIRESMLEELDKRDWLESFLVEHREELTEREASDLERQIEDADRQFEYYEKMLDMGTDLREELVAELQNVQTAIEGIDAFQEGGIASLFEALGDSNLLRQGNVTRQVGGILETVAGEGGIASILGKFDATAGIARIIGSVAKFAGPAMIALSAIEMGVNFVGDLLKTNNDLNQKQLQTTGEKGSILDNIMLGAGLAASSKFDAFINGLDERTVEQMQERLMGKGLAFGSQEYDEGYDFAIRAKRDYGMDPSKSVELFSQTVLRGNQTMEDLNSVMEELSKTVQDSRVSMDEATEEYVNNLKKLEGATGSTELAAGIEEEIQREFSGSSELQNMVTQIVSKAQASDDYFYRERVAEMEESGMSPEQAAVNAALEMFVENGGANAMRWGVYGQNGPERAFWQADIDGKGTIMEQVLNGEPGEAEESIRRLMSGEADVSSYNASYFDGIGNIMSTVHSALGGMNIDLENVEADEGKSKEETLFSGLQGGVERQREFEQATASIQGVDAYSEFGSRGDQSSNEVATRLAAKSGGYSEDEFGYTVNAIAGSGGFVTAQDEAMLRGMGGEQRQAFMSSLMEEYSEASGANAAIAEADGRNKIAAMAAAGDTRMPANSNVIDWYSGSGQLESRYEDFGTFMRSAEGLAAYRSALAEASRDESIARDESREWKGRFVLENAADGIVAVVDASNGERSLNRDATPDTARR